MTVQRQIVDQGQVAEVGRVSQARMFAQPVSASICLNR
jgi:hypothetical protein